MNILYSIISEENIIESVKYNINKDIYDEVICYEYIQTKLRHTKRNLGNSDIIHFFEFENVMDTNFEINNIIIDKIVTFDHLYNKPNFDSRYGENKSTGPNSVVFSRRKDLLISKIYYYRELVQEYANKNESRLLELIEEDNSILIEDNEIIFKLKPNKYRCSFFIMESTKNLFDSEENLFEYFNYYYDNVKINCVENTYFMLPNGFMTKLPYSIEPFTKDGYGYSMHHSSKRELIDFAKKNKDKFYYNMLMNSYMQLILYAKNLNGIFLSNYTSTWLKKDFGITSYYIDTRLNEYLNLTLIEFKENYNLDFIRTFEKEYIDFLIARIPYTKYRTKNGIFFSDYFDINDYEISTHSSLNHQISIMNLSFIVYSIYKEKNI